LSGFDINIGSCLLCYQYCVIHSFTSVTY